MTRPLAASLTYWRRLTVDALTALAALALALAAFNGTTDVLQQLFAAAVLLASAAMLEPQPMVRRIKRRPGQASRPFAIPA
jgi:hypothetical protein